MDNRLKMEVPYFQSPNDIFEIGLDSYELSVYLYLSRCGNNKSSAFPSYSTIAEKTKMSRVKVISVIKRLIERKLIIKHVRYQQSNIYEIVSNLSELVNEINQTSKPHLLGVVNEINQAGKCGEPYKEQQEKELIKKELTTTEKENVVVVKNLIESFKKKYKGDLDPKLLNNLVKEKGIDIVKKCTDIFGDYVSSANEVEKVFYKFCKTWGTEEQFKKNTGYKNYNNNKPVQSTNYEQREYDDDFFNNLYDNIDYIK